MSALAGAGGARARPSLWQRMFQIAGLLLALFVLEQNAEGVAKALRVHPTAGTISGAGKLASLAGSARTAYRVVSLDPTSPLATVGARAGDTIVLDHSLQSTTNFSINAPVGLTLRSPSPRHARVRAVPLRGAPDRLNATLYVAYLACDGFAVFLLICGRARTSSIELGIALAAFAVPSLHIQPLAVGAAIFTPAALATMSTFAIADVAFLAFALKMERRTVRTHNIGVLSAASVTAVLATCSVAMLMVYWLTGYTPFPALDAYTVFSTCDTAPLLVTLAILVDAGRRADQDTWRRHATVLVGLGMIVFSQAATNLGEVLDDPVVRDAATWMQIFACVVGPALMTYGVLGQRVIDVGFVVNRTLVYGAVSGVLLIAFGLAEWGVNLLMPVHGRGANALLAGALALAAYLAFDRVRGGVERLVERLFFRRWRERETELKAFLQEAPFISRPQALSNAALAAVRRFTDDAQAAIYLRAPDGDFRRLEGEVEGLGERLDADARFLVRLRADRRPLEASGPGSVSLLLPMANRNELTGVIVVGRRPDGGAWRPDQVAHLDGAARDVGQDLQALELERLQTVVETLCRAVSVSGSGGQPPKIGADPA